MLTRGIPHRSIGDALPVPARQKIRPVTVAVFIARRLSAAARYTVGIGVLRLGQDVPTIVIGVLPCQTCRFVLLPDQPLQRVIEIRRRLPVDRVCQNTAVGVVGVRMRQRRAVISVRQRPDLLRGEHVVHIA